MAAIVGRDVVGQREQTVRRSRWRRSERRGMCESRCRDGAVGEISSSLKNLKRPWDTLVLVAFVFP
jgi:hypothetical protein